MEAIENTILLEFESEYYNKTRQEQYLKELLNSGQLTEKTEEIVRYLFHKNYYTESVDDPKYEVLERLPDNSYKYRFSIEGNYDYKKVNYCFYVEDKQDKKTKQSLSYKKLTGKIVSTASKYRSLVLDQIQEFKAEEAKRLKISQDQIRNYDVDHVSPTFNEILNKFLALHKDQEIGITTSTKTYYKLNYGGKDITQDWQNYHMENASLQLLLREEHKQKTKQEQKMKQN